MSTLIRFIWLILVLSVFDKAFGGECPKAKYPPKNGGIRPTPYFVHVWISRYDYGEHSCIGVTRKNNTVVIPEWCITFGNEKGGRIAIYAPKLTGQVTSYSRGCAYERYDQQFDLIYEDDDLRELIATSDGSHIFNLPNAVVLQIPTNMTRFATVCTWIKGNLFDNPVAPAVVSWRRGPNAEFYLVQKAIDESRKEKKSFEYLRKGVEDVAEALISIDPRDNGVVFEGFFKDPPKIPDFKTL
ncbi:uncharacterized protein LOC141852634 [Brevipalpus obovatus]|uniref:uncharacterized protein LOC141852633 n=1 Tax=Brevipalpus obovatus TaxID=246614 RepID=UPI003D9F48C9